jgi:glycine cleavage system H protein
MAGRVVAATFRKVGTHRDAKRSVATLESGKWVGGVPAPFDGTIERINPAVQADPGLVNVTPYTDAWLVVMRPDDLQDAYARLKRGPEAIEALKAWVDKYSLQCMRCTQ